MIVRNVSYTVNGETQFYVHAADGDGIAQVVAVCDDGAGSWVTADLVDSGQGWYGGCGTAATRAYVQVVDGSGRVTNSLWQVPDVGEVRPFVVNLPMIGR